MMLPSFYTNPAVWHIMGTWSDARGTSALLAQDCPMPQGAPRVELLKERPAGSWERQQISVRNPSCATTTSCPMPAWPSLSPLFELSCWFRPCFLLLLQRSQVSFQDNLRLHKGANSASLIEREQNKRI